MSTSSAQKPPSIRPEDAKATTAADMPSSASSSSASASSSLSSSSSSPPLQLPASTQNAATTKPHTGLLDAQKLLASIALSRPTPFGSIPQRRASDGGRLRRQQPRRHDLGLVNALATSPPSSASQRTPTQSLYARRRSKEYADHDTDALLSSAGNAALHVTDAAAAAAFHYHDEDWTRGTGIIADLKGKGKMTKETPNDEIQFSLSPSSPASSPSSPQEEWDSHSAATSATRHARSRQATSSRSRESTSPSTPASSRSSSLRRKPSLLVQQNFSAPTASSHTVPAVGRTTANGATVNSDNRSTLRTARRSSGKESQSLAEHGMLAEATLPSLYSMSRGRSAHVSPSRRWDRRGASVSVLSCAPFQLQGAQHEAAKVSNMASGSTTRSSKTRADSAGSLEAALFESDDDAELFASSDENDDTEEDIRQSQGASRVSSRRTSIERDRRRELRILLAPSSSSCESQSGSQGRSFEQSQAPPLSASDDFAGSDDRASLGGASLESNEKSPLKASLRCESPKGTRRSTSLSPPAQMAVANAEMADDDSDGAIGPSAATILDRRAQSGRHLLPVALKSIAPAHASTLDVILAGMTPDEKPSAEVQPRGPDLAFETARHHADIDDTNRTNPASGANSARPRTTSVLVDADTDPLLGSSFGSVADNIQIEAVEWNDALSRRASKSSLAMSPSSSPRPDSAKSMSTRKSVAEQEDERRTGFAAAYQNRIAALSLRLWTPGKNARDAASVAVAPSVPANAKPEQSDTHESLLSSSWRHLTSLPNLLLMPTLGASASAAKAPPSAHRSDGGSATSLEAKDDAAILDTNAAHAVEAHLSKRQDVDRTIVAIDRALGETVQPSSSSSEAYSSQDESLDSVTRTPSKRVATDVPLQSPSRSGRGVMTPLEADADISAYVSGLGLPIDPDVELSSVVHLQTFRTDSHARRATSTSRRDSASTTTHRRRVSEDLAATRRTASPPTASKGHESLDSLFVDARQKQVDQTSPDTPSASEAKKRSSVRRRRSPSSQRTGKAVDRSRAPATLPRCSRPAVSAPVPGDFTAYSDHSHSEDDSHTSDTTCSDTEQHRSQSRAAEEEERPISPARDEDEERSARGRGRRSRQRRATSPASQQQCAIGLFSSSTSLSRTRSGSRRLQGLAPSSATAASVQRVRSSPDLSRMSVTLYEDGKGRSAASSATNSEDEEDGNDLFAGRRGRAGSVKRVSVSLSASEHSSASSRQQWPPGMSSNAVDMHRRGSVPVGSTTNDELGATAIGGAALSSSRRRSLPNADAASQSVLAAAAAMPAGSSSSSRLPIVGAESITHLAGRPSMVSNGAHLLMLSLELEMMRNRKITGSLKPRWLKARMRTEPFGPAAIVAMMAERALGGGGGGESSRGNADAGTMSDADDYCTCGDAISVDGMDVDKQEAPPSPPLKTTPRPAKPHEHPAHIGLHTSHHRSHCRSGRHAHRQRRSTNTTPTTATDSIAAQPRRGSSLRFEVMPSATTV